ncbi:PDZ domain-containing protein [Trinickia caryophylli]|nr:trypsin-like peptidase domain-containing protein [Trinickia caryophylli]PMS11467.1 PDZ domain-containing protein [Trinickia caryophylli]TRX17533.1 PDZ domain-containing protein [Trinickia caryophylli]
MPLAARAAPPAASSASSSTGSSTASSARTASPLSGGSAARSAPDFATIVERYGPAVVNIGVLREGEEQAMAPELDNLAPDDPIAALLPAPAAGQASRQNRAREPRVARNGGSGFIVSADGLVVTTAHVVNGADDVIVTLTDRRRFKARVLGVDPQSDIALIQMQGASRLPTVRLGDASRVRAGDEVLAIGAPDGPQNTVTSGLVSATPHVRPDGTRFPFLQTDIAVNPDNSGGPLLNRSGEAIGVDIQIYADSERFRTMTFAVPIEAAVKLRARLRGTGATSAEPGIAAQDLDPGLAAAFGVPRAQGALVTAVPGAAPGAAKNGLKVGDVVTQVNGKPVAQAADLRDALDALAPGTKATLRIIRGKKPMTVTVVASAAAIAAPVGGGAVATAAEELERVGLSVHPLAEAEKRAGGPESGLVVDASTGLAANAGIQPGDLVLSVNGTPVSSREGLATLLATGGKGVALLIERENVRSFVPLELR